MSATLLASSSLSTTADTYFYTLAPLLDGYAVIASDDALRLFDLPSLAAKLVIPKCNKGLTCITTDAKQQTAFTSGRDGLVKAWDPRTGRQATQFQELKGAGIATIACQDQYLAAGTESTSEGLGDVRVSVYDMRKTGQPLRTYTDSHTDTVTDLHWHPSQKSILLSGSTDGLVSIFDIEQADEDDALKQVLNPKSAIHHVGLLADDQAYVLTTDEQFFIYGLDKTGTAEDEALPAATLGDLRPQLNCMYIIDLLQHNGSVMLAHGHNENKTLALTTIDSQTLSVGLTTHLPGAHGEEVVRDFKMVQSHQMLLSCGEDGKVNCWQLPSQAIGSSAEIMDVEEDEDATLRKTKKKQKMKEVAKKEKRFAPY